MNTSIVDLAHDAELLESCTKRNDKYTVRRILDVHYSYFRVRQSGGANSSTSETGEKSNNNKSSEGGGSGGGDFSPSTHFPLNKSSLFSSSFKKKCVPSIFFNILHLAIENNSLDVLRICLKYGLNPNECGTTLRKIFLDGNGCSNSASGSCFNYEEHFLGRCKKTVRYPLKCVYCKTKWEREMALLQQKKTTTMTTTIQTVTTTTLTTTVNSSIKQTQALLYEYETKQQVVHAASLESKSGPTTTTTEKNTTMSQSDKEATTSATTNTTANSTSFELSPEITSLEQINYASFLYLIRLPPLFLSVSKCNHEATELLLTYGACPNVQDDLGKTLSASKKKQENNDFNPTSSHK